MFTILVVEDNPDMRELFCTVLADSGYRAIPATDGLDALKIMEKEYIDLMVADVMMPNMDGYELTKSLRDANYDLPILIVTAKDQFDDIQLGFRAGTDDYMIKPINVKELVLRVEALLRRAKIDHKPADQKQQPERRQDQMRHLPASFLRNARVRIFVFAGCRLKYAAAHRRSQNK